MTEKPSEIGISAELPSGAPTNSALTGSAVAESSVSKSVALDTSGSVSSQPGRSATVEGSFSGKRAAEIVGITYRQLDYWARTDLVRPSHADASGSGSRRRYSYKDLLELKVIKTLLDAGIKLESVRQVFSFMREQLGEDVASANLVIHGSTSVLTRSGEELIDLVRKGQGVLNVLPLAGIKDEVDAKIVELQPALATSSSQTDLALPG